jgi:hypothetical protein
MYETEKVEEILRKRPNKSKPAYSGNQNTPFTALLNAIDPEREAQHEEFLRRLGQKGNAFVYTPSRKKPKKPRKPKRKTKVASFDEKLERTMAWLAETFPALFDPTQPPKPLDVHIVRDVKEYYKQHCVKKKYPADLVIKAALYRYMESPAYSECLVKGEPRYNVKGEVSGVV